MSVTYDEPFGPFFGKAYREGYAKVQEREARSAARDAGYAANMMQHPGIYMLVCDETKHAYIGSTANLRNRERDWRRPQSVKSRKMLVYLASGIDWTKIRFVVLREFPPGTDKATLFTCERRCIERALAKGVKLLNMELPRPHGGGDPI